MIRWNWDFRLKLKDFTSYCWSTFRSVLNVSITCTNSYLDHSMYSSLSISFLSLGNHPVSYNISSSSNLKYVKTFITNICQICLIDRNSRIIPYSFKIKKGKITWLLYIFFKTKILPALKWLTIFAFCWVPTFTFWVDNAINQICIYWASITFSWDS